MLDLSIVPIDLHLTNMVANSCNKDQPISNIVYNPSQVLSEKITPEPSIEFSNYDVLLMPCDAIEPVRFAPGNHVGNQRFRVLLSLFRQRYLQADECGDEEECAKIAREVMDTVYQKCVPNGRFYEQGRDNQGQELQLDSTIINIILRSLDNEPTDSLHYEERGSKRVCRRSSAFGSIVSTDSEEDTVISPNPFDVICEANELKLKQDCQHTGNNRLKVMLDMRIESYKKWDLVGKRTIAQEVVVSIMDDAFSQFLRLDERTGMFKPISRESAAACIKNSLDTTTEGEKRRFRESEVKKLMDRKKKKAVLGRFERQKGNSCKLRNSTSTPTSFTACQLLGQQVEI